LPFELVLKEGMKRKMAGFAVGAQPMRERSFVKGTSASNGGVLLGNERTSKREEQNNIALHSQIGIEHQRCGLMSLQVRP